MTIIETMLINLFSPFEILCSCIAERKDFKYICRRVVCHKTMLYQKIIFTHIVEGDSKYARKLKHTPCGMLCYFIALHQGHLQ